MLELCKHDIVKFRDIVDQAFSAPTLAKAFEIIEHHERGFWFHIKGTRGNSARNTINPNPKIVKHITGDE